ncbi:MAG: serine hydrolase [Planctomycetota bacterium]
MRYPARLATLACTLITAVHASAQCRTSTGCASEAFAAVDQAVLDVMCNNDIPGATLAVAYDGVIVYERGFGTSDIFRQQPMEPDALMRIASVSKPLTVSAARTLVDQGAFELSDYAFDLGQQGGTGLLTANPFPSLGDPRLADITVLDLIRHRAGWNRYLVGDWIFSELLVARELGVAPPPGRQNTIDWIAGQPLQFTPGTDTVYSNIGCLVLGLIVEDFTGLPIDQAIQQLVLDPIGVDDDDHAAGRTFEPDTDPREPWYHAPRLFVNVFDPTGPLVPSPYGAWDHEALAGQGGQIATASALARVAAHRWVNGSNIGLPKSPTLRGNWRWNHTGVLDGTGALIRQRGDGVTYAVLFNSRGFGGTVRNALDIAFDDMIDSAPFPTSPPNCCPADTNGDGVVNPADFNAWVIAFNTQTPACDQNGDGLCNPADFNAWVINFNDSCD